MVAQVAYVSSASLAPPDTGNLARWVFLRLLGLVYLAAFVSLWVQVHGLIGEEGVAPAAPYLEAVGDWFREQHGGGTWWGLSWWGVSWWKVPTLAWGRGAGDGALDLMCGAGTLCAALLLVGLVPRAALALLFALYLSLVNIGADFMPHVGDSLLLEAGFLAIFYAPSGVFPSVATAPPPAILTWLLRFLLFKVIFSAGIVKLTGADPSWRDLVALERGYDGQALPLRLAWYLHLAPDWVHRVMAGITLAVELLPPALVLLPHSRLRAISAGAIAALMACGALTGVHGVTPLLVVALCVIACDDPSLARVVPHRLVLASLRGDGRRQTQARRITAGVVAMLLLPCQALTLLSVLPTSIRGSARSAAAEGAEGWSAWLGSALVLRDELRELIAPFLIVSAYEVRAEAPGERQVIVVEGSMDGRDWLPFEPPVVPTDPARAPPLFTFLHLPRLDWRLHLAGRGRCQQAPWIHRLQRRLLQGSEPVAGLLQKDPFRGRSPRYVRTRSVPYRFSGWGDRSETGSWWLVEPGEAFCPVADH